MSAPTALTAVPTENKKNTTDRGQTSICEAVPCSINILMMKRVLLLAILCLGWAVHAQQHIPMSVKELAPDFGIRPIFLDDTVHLSRYLDSLPLSNSALTDTCVTINAKLMAMENVLLYDYRHSNDTVWIDASHYLEDYKLYSTKIKQLSTYVLDRAHQYIESEHIRRDNNQQTRLNLRKDTIDSYHRSIINACDGIGIDDKERKKQLKDIYYSYLSVYNRYDFSMKAKDSSYIESLDQFCEFQRHLLDNVLSRNNYDVRINNFANTLKTRCGRNHVDVVRSYQRAFRKSDIPVQFSSIREYRNYIDSLQGIIEIQNAYLEVVNLREQIEANGKRINSLYYPKFNDAAKTYAMAASKVNTTPEFNTRRDAAEFIFHLREFIKVQQCYEQDYARLMAINDHADSISHRCGLRYGDVAKAYQSAHAKNIMLPNYQSVDDARRFTRDMDQFEQLQRQYDTVIDMRILIDQTKDSINKGWMSHLIVYNGFQNIRKQFALTPTFINVYEGEEFILHLEDFLDIERSCLNAIQLYETYKRQGDKLTPELQPYRNIRRAYQQLEREYVNIKTINHFSDLRTFIHQMEAFITVQDAIKSKLNTNNTILLDDKLREVKESARIEALLGL